MKIFFTAAKEEDIHDGSLVPNNPERAHDIYRLREHVERNNRNRVNRPESPYRFICTYY